MPTPDPNYAERLQAWLDKLNGRYNNGGTDWRLTELPVRVPQPLKFHTHPAWDAEVMEAALQHTNPDILFLTEEDIKFLTDCGISLKDCLRVSL
jgi:hypothetical protein